MCINRFSCSLFGLLFLILLFQATSVTSSSFFGNMHNQGRFGSGMKSSSQHREFYDTLGLKSDCSENDIKQAYRTKAKTMHPDKGGNEEEYKKIVAAYETLKDPKKRQLYDMYGTKEGQGVGAEFSQQQPGQQQQFNAEDIFQSMFFDRFREQFSIPQTYQLDLTLEDFYSGRTLPVRLGSKEFDLRIEPGMPSGTRIQKQIQDERGILRDIILVLNQQKHKVYTRIQDDLMIDVTITLSEALFGFQRIMKHLDGTEFTINSRNYNQNTHISPNSNSISGSSKGNNNSPSEVLDNGDILCVEGLGMPVYDTNSDNSRHGRKDRANTLRKRGNLYVKLTLQMPSKLTLNRDQQEILRDLLSPSPTITSYRDVTDTASNTDTVTAPQKGVKSSHMEFINATADTGASHSSRNNAQSAKAINVQNQQRTSVKQNDVNRFVNDLSTAASALKSFFSKALNGTGTANNATVDTAQTKSHTANKVETDTGTATETSSTDREKHQTSTAAPLPQFKPAETTAATLKTSVRKPPPAASPPPTAKGKVYTAIKLNMKQFQERERQRQREQERQRQQQSEDDNEGFGGFTGFGGGDGGGNTFYFR